MCEASVPIGHPLMCNTKLYSNTGLNHSSIQGETPLFLAAREGKLEAVKLLVYHQAARHIADGMDQTPVDVARDRLHSDIEEVSVLLY